jgi:hypothetical protein
MAATMSIVPLAAGTSSVKDTALSCGFLGTLLEHPSICRHTRHDGAAPTNERSMHPMLHMAHERKLICLAHAYVTIPALRLNNIVYGDPSRVIDTRYRCFPGVPLATSYNWLCRCLLCGEHSQTSVAEGMAAVEVLLFRHKTNGRLEVRLCARIICTSCSNAHFFKTAAARARMTRDLFPFVMYTFELQLAIMSHVIRGKRQRKVSVIHCMKNFVPLFSTSACKMCAKPMQASATVAHSTVSHYCGAECSNYYRAMYSFSPYYMPVEETIRWNRCLHFYIKEHFQTNATPFVQHLASNTTMGRLCANPQCMQVLPSPTTPNGGRGKRLPARVTCKMCGVLTYCLKNTNRAGTQCQYIDKKRHHRNCKAWRTNAHGVIRSLHNSVVSL